MFGMSKGASSSWFLKRENGFKKYFLMQYKEYMLLIFLALSYISFKAESAMDLFGIVATIAFVACVTSILFTGLNWMVQEFRYERRVTH